VIVRVRAILSGDNGSQPLLLYVPQDAKIAIGDDVATSGAGGVFPRGLRIGKVTGDLTKPRAGLRAQLDRLEYLSVLFFDDPASAMMGEPHGGARETAAAARGDHARDPSALRREP
jgi:rod shape-determining protein MreC